MQENPSRIEPALIESPSPVLLDLMAELVQKSTDLGKSLHPRTAAHLAGLVRIMNTYYSNLIEGHNTRPRDIERALTGELDTDQERRNLQIEAVAHVRVQTMIDEQYEARELPDPTSCSFICWLHGEFYKGAPEETLQISGSGRNIVMVPGVWRTGEGQDNAVGRHVPPSSMYVPAFMDYFERRYAPVYAGIAQTILAIPPAHHRLNYIHPFLDGNGRVSRLMSHAMVMRAGIGAHGLWSISRGLARGLESRGDYKQMMDMADLPRRNDYDGRGNLSLQSLQDFSIWFLKVCIDQVEYMSGLFDLRTLQERIQRMLLTEGRFKPEAVYLLREAFLRGQFERGEIARITGLPERTARRVALDLITSGLLKSDTPKGALYLGFPEEALEYLFPRLYPQT